MRILIIENDEETADLLRDILGYAGHTVDHAPDGASGLAMAGERN